MTDERSADQIITDIFGLPPSKRECALITRGALLEATSSTSRRLSSAWSSSSPKLSARSRR